MNLHALIKHPNGKHWHGFYPRAGKAYFMRMIRIYQEDRFQVKIVRHKTP